MAYLCMYIRHGTTNNAPRSSGLGLLGLGVDGLDLGEQSARGVVDAVLLELVVMPRPPAPSVVVSAPVPPSGAPQKGGHKRNDLTHKLWTQKIDVKHTHHIARQTRFRRFRALSTHE